MKRICVFLVWVWVVTARAADWEAVSLANVSTNAAYFQVAGKEICLQPGGSFELHGVSTVSWTPLPSADWVTVLGQVARDVTTADGSYTNLAYTVCLPYVDSGVSVGGSNLFVPSAYIVAAPHYDAQAQGEARIEAGWEAGCLLSALFLGFIGVRWAMGMISDGDTWE